MDTISLSGPWELLLDPTGDENSESVFKDDADGTIFLPGTTDEYGYGEKNSNRSRTHLQRSHRYEGPAWYRRTISLPDCWMDKRVSLLLERTRPTEVWINGERCGTRECLSTPHIYDITKAIRSGELEILVKVDNTSCSMERPGVSRSHAVSEHTQTNWNGILGDVQLRAAPKIRITDVQTFPNPGRNAVNIKVNLETNNQEISGTIVAAARSVTDDRIHAPDTIEKQISVADDGGSVFEGSTLDFTYTLGPDALLWSEFSPAVYDLTVSIESTKNGTTHTDEFKTEFGLREFSTDDTQFSINETTIFLRGRTDCCVFPDTAYPPMTTAEWMRHMETAKSYGINHYRFHSWCPPEAAFNAADEVGIYLQPECSLWNNGTALDDDDSYTYYKREANRIFAAYGNHPSFVLFTLGNENKGDEKRMTDLVRHCRDFDCRRLYAYGANNFLTSPHPGDSDDFFVTANVPEDPKADPEEVGRTPIRGTGHVNNSIPSTNVDYEEKIEAYNLPVVGHEIGQYQIYPDYDEVRKYGGVLRAKNLERFERSLADRYMKNLDKEFRSASGELSLICYREDIEAAFRTNGFGGFQLLGLDDFPGQGTALVGILDSYMESKGLIQPHAWRRFCDARVPLLSFDRYTYTTNQEFTAKALLANYGPGPLTDVTATWSISTADGTEYATGLIEVDKIEQGDLATIGGINTCLTNIEKAASLEVSMEIRGDDPKGGSNLELQTSYPIWVYPEVTGQTIDRSAVSISSQYDEKTRAQLKAGETVLLIPNARALRSSLRGSFQPDFWNYEIFKQNGKPGTLGMMTDADHPLYDDFPTSNSANWQWWSLLRNSRPVVLDDAPAEFTPTIQVIDTIYRNHKLGVYFETSVGDGKLAICTLDLSGSAPSTQQFIRSLTSYLASESFEPEPALSTDLLESLFGVSQNEQRLFGDDANSWPEHE